MKKTEIILGEFFIPETPGKVRSGTFNFSKDDRMVLDLGGYINSTEDRKISVPIIYGTDSKSGDRISLVNCQCLPGWPNEVSYLVNEVYTGDWVDKVTDDIYHSIEMEMTGLSEWFRERISVLQQSGEESIDAKHWEKCWQIDSDTELILKYFMTETHQGHGLLFKPEHLIRIKCKRLLSRKKLYNMGVSVRNFLGVFLRNVPEILSMSFAKGDDSLVHLYIRHFLDKEEDDIVGKRSLFYDLETYLPGALKQWFKNPKLLDQILFLYITSKEITIAEIAFTEITIALEIFHKHFLQPKDEEENRTIKQDVLLRMQNESISESSRKSNQRWTQRMRYVHMWMELEKIPFFKDLWKSPFQYILKLNESRNYYTHYERESNESAKDNISLVWTSNQLFYKNIELRMWLKGLLLNYLYIHPAGIGIIINMQHKSYFYIDYESNEYSINNL